MAYRTMNHFSSKWIVRCHLRHHSTQRSVWMSTGISPLVVPSSIWHFIHFFIAAFLLFWLFLPYTRQLSPFWSLYDTGLVCCELLTPWTKLRHDLLISTLWRPSVLLSCRFFVVTLAVPLHLGCIVTDIRRAVSRCQSRWSLTDGDLRPSRGCAGMLRLLQLKNRADTDWSPWRIAEITGACQSLSIDSQLHYSMFSPVTVCVCGLWESLTALGCLLEISSFISCPCWRGLRLVREVYDSGDCSSLAKKEILLFQHRT